MVYECEPTSSRGVEQAGTGGVLVPANPHHPGYYSHTFTIPKKTGEQRLIINLKGLYHYIPYVHFKIENIQHLQDILVKIDLKAAYYSVSIHPKSQDLFRVWWNSRPYEFTCLPFGLSSAPRTFTKLLKPVSDLCRG